MTSSLRWIEDSQLAWASGRAVDSTRPSYAPTVGANLFLSALHKATEQEFSAADGAELKDTDRRPAKMRAFISSSALAVNFFDAWRDADLNALGPALGLPGAIGRLRFEYQPTGYPVGPRSPNLDLLITLGNEDRVGVESKFAEPFRAPGADAMMSPKYYPEAPGLWDRAGLARSQILAGRLTARWQYLDVAQLLKHMLGLASAHDGPSTLLYLWYDTGLPDAAAHGNEIARFSDEVRGDRVKFCARSYQSVFAALRDVADPVPGWRAYMAHRYLSAPEAV